MKFTKEREIETITIEGHYRGSEESHNRRKKKERQEGCSRELIELAKDILFFENHMQAAEEENQRYGWVMKREVRWNSLQVKLQQNMYAILK